MKPPDRPALESRADIQHPLLCEYGHHHHHRTLQTEATRRGQGATVRGISREVLARDAAWSLADGSCKELTTAWAVWESRYAAAATAQSRLAALAEPTAVCASCPITAECADLAELSCYTGIAAAQGYRNGRPDQARRRHPKQRRSA